jgi:hypothetical protein
MKAILVTGEEITLHYMQWETAANHARGPTHHLHFRGIVHSHLDFTADDVERGLNPRTYNPGSYVLLEHIEAIEVDNPKTDEPLIQVRLYNGDVVSVPTKWLTIMDGPWTHAYYPNGDMMGRVSKVEDRFFGRAVLRKDIAEVLG